MLETSIGGALMSDSEMKRSALVIATLSAFLTPIMGSAVNVALPAIQKEFQMNAVLLSWIATSYLLAAAVSLVPFGRLADIYGRKKIFTMGVVLFTVASFLSAISVSASMLIACRVFQGVGGGMIFSNGLAILSSVFPPTERGKAIGINAAAVYVGLSIGPFLGGFLTHQLSWRSIFLLGVPLGLIIICVLMWKLKGEWAGSKGEKFDFEGSLIYALAIVAIMYGFSLLPTFTSLWIILLGLASVLGFVRWEVKTKNPVFQLDLFRTNKVFAFSNLAALLNYCSTFAVLFLLSLYLQYIKGLTPQSAGVILASQFIVQAAF
jgi:EmrB/QacA subfamily drug resistance transporter